MIMFQLKIVPWNANGLNIVSFSQWLVKLDQGNIVIIRGWIMEFWMRYDVSLCQ